MKDTRVRGPDKRPPQGVVGEPFRQLASRKSFDEILLDRQEESQGIALDEHQARQPEPMVEGERDRHEHGDRQAVWPGEPSGDRRRGFMCISPRLRLHIRFAT